MKKLIAVLAVIVVIFVVCYILMFTRVSKNNDEIEVTIPIGTNVSKIADILKENKIIRSKLGFKIYVKLNKVSDFQAGVYQLKQNMSLKEITETLKTGKMYDPNELSFTYLEGKNMRWLAAKIASSTNNQEEDVYNLLEDEEYLDSLIEKYWFITEEIKNKDIYYSLEGYLFPDTYSLKNKDVTVKDIFKKMLDQMEDILESYKEDIENSKYNVHELLTIASIIETESTKQEDRKDVSSVIYNRLKNRMAIQSDVTTYYAIKVDMGERDLYYKELNAYNPYNTRGPNMEGKLPVGPISSVSKTSIEAAINPSSTDYYYFVADKNGKLYFSKTNSEHEKIVSELKTKGLWFEY